MCNGLAGHRDVAAREDGLAAGQEEQRVVTLRQIDEIKLHAWFPRELSGLPYLQLVEGAQHHVPRCRLRERGV